VCEVVNPSRTAARLIARRENACEFMFWMSPCLADLTHVQRDAGSVWTVNKAWDHRYDVEAWITMSLALLAISRPGTAVPDQECSQ